MSREVDERVVAMYFDNKDFEKNAKTTIDTLGQLREEMNLDEAVKGFESLKTATNKLDLDKVDRKAKLLKSTMTGLGSVMSKALDIGTAPLQSLNNLYNTFKGYVSKFIGFDLAGKFVGTFESAAQQLMVQPVTAGWNEYELKMDSIKTIMSGSGESLDVVKKKLEELNTYADNTVYSFSDMTNNIGKFTNNGVKLDDATAAIKGVANAAADAGQGAAEASRAMYNISQALGVGSMKLVDWKSLENANIATTKLKDTFLQVGAAMGKIRKFTDKDGKIHYFDKDTKVDEKKVKKLAGSELEAYLEGLQKKTKNKAEEITAENFRESLKNDWLDKEAMLNTFKIYGGDDLDIDTLQSWGFTEEEALEMQKIGKEAAKAATEVRTFSKMWDALKEAAQSGWAQSMEYVFGDMEEATKLWTDLNEIIGGVLSKSADDRNAALLEWRGMYKDTNGELHKITKESDDYWLTNPGKIRDAEDGREILIKSFRELIEVIGSLGSVASEAWTSVFGKLDGKKLLEITYGFRDFVNNIKAWLGTTEDAESRLSKIKKGLTGLFSVIKTVVNFIKIGFNLVSRLVKPVASVFVDLFGTIGEFFTGMGDLKPDEVFVKLGEGIETLWNKLKSLFTVGEDGSTPISTWLSNLWSDLKKTVREWANENGLGGTLDAVKSVWSSITGWQGWTDIANAFETAKEDVEKAWTTISGWSGWTSIGKFFTDTWGWIRGLVTGGKKYDSRGFELNETSDAPIVTWLKGIWESVSTFWNETILGTAKPVWDAIAKFAGNTWSWLKEQFAATEGGNERQTPEEAPIVTWLKGIWESVSTFWNETILGTARPVWESIASFAGNIWGWLQEQFTAPPAYDEKGFKLNTDPPIVTWLKGIWESVSTFWNDTILGTARPVWEAIATFAGNTWGWLQKQFSAANAYDDRGFKLNTEAPVVTWLKGVWKSIQETWSEITEAGRPIWESISQFMNDIFGWMAGLLSDASAEGAENQLDEVGEVSLAVTDLAEKMPDEKSVSLIERIMNALSGVWDSITKFTSSITVDPVIEKVWDNIVKIFEIIGVVIDKVVGVLHGAIVQGDLSSWLAVGGVAVIAFIFKIVDYFTSKVKARNIANLATIAEKSQSIGLQFLEVAAGIALLVTAIATLNALDEGAAWRAVGQIVIIGGVLAAIVIAINKSKSPAEEIQDAAVTGWERVGQSLIKWAGIMGTVAIVMKMLPDIIKALGDTKKEGIGSDVLQTLTGAMEVIGGAMVAFALMQRIAPKGIDPMATVKSVASVMAGIAVALAALIGAGGLMDTLHTLIKDATGYGKDDYIAYAVKWINDMGTLFEALGEALGKLIGGFFGGIVGGYNTAEQNEEQRSIEAQLEWLGKIADTMDPSSLTKLGAISNLLDRISSAHYDSQQMQLITNELPGLGSALQQFVVNLNALEDGRSLDEGWFNRSLEALQIVQAFADAMVTLNDAFMLYSSGMNLNEEDMLSLFDLYSKAAGKLAQAIQTGLGEEGSLSFNATPIIDSIVVALGLGETAIAKAVHNMVQEGMDAADKLGGYKPPQEDNSGFDDTTLNFLNGLSGLTDGSTFDFSGVVESITGENGLVAQVTGGLEGLPDMNDLLKDKGYTFTDEEGNTIDIVSEIAGQMTELQTAVDQLPAFEIKITPVFDMTGMTAESLQQQLNQRTAGLTMNMPGMTVQVDNSAMVNQLRAANSRLDSLSTRVSNLAVVTASSISSLSGHMDGIAESVAGLKLYLDSDTLVGAIAGKLNYAIGAQTITYLRTGVLPKWSNAQNTGYDLAAHAVR